MVSPLGASLDGMVASLVQQVQHCDSEELTDHTSHRTHPHCHNCVPQSSWIGKCDHQSPQRPLGYRGEGNRKAAGGDAESGRSRPMVGLEVCQHSASQGSLLGKD